MNAFCQSESSRYNGNRTLDLLESVITFTVPEKKVLKTDGVFSQSEFFCIK